MSLTIEPDFQTFIARITKILRASALLFPNSIDGNTRGNYSRNMQLILREQFRKLSCLVSFYSCNDLRPHWGKVDL